MTLSRVRCSQWAVVILAPLLAAPACEEEAALAVQFRPILSAPVGRADTRIVRVVNTGALDAKLGEVSAAALGLAAPFSLVPGGTCVSGGVVPKGYGSCEFVIGFNAPQARQYSDDFTLAYAPAAGGESRTLVVPVVGTGEEPIRVTAPYRAFTNRPLATVTDAEVVVQNHGGYAVTLGDVGGGRLGLTPPFSAVGGTCASGAVLAPNGTCTIVVRFAATQLGVFDDVLGFEYNWAESGAGPVPAGTPIHGSTVVPITLAADPLLLAPVAVGATAQQVIVVKNSGGAPAVLGTISDAALGLAAPFALSGGSCSTGLALAPNGGSCTLNVTFAPTSAGAANANLVLRYTFGAFGSRSVSHTIPATAVAPSSTDCYATGCGTGQVCAQISSNASGAGTCVSVPDPPAGCMAPCLWEARKKCLPVLGACNSEITNDPADSTRQTETLCDPRTRWAERDERLYQSVVIGSSYRNNGATCFTSGMKMVGANYYEQPYTDGTGPIAVGLFLVPNDGTRSVWCGPHTSVAGLDPADAYKESITAPECVAWQRQYLDWTRCRSQASGSCAGF
jgi:hypothetical protein